MRPQPAPRRHRPAHDAGSSSADPVRDAAGDPDVRGPWPFTGRAAALAAARGAIRSRTGKALVVCGPSGIGKSRLVAEAAAEAAAEGWLVLRITADRALSEIPLGALLPALPEGSAVLDALARHPGTPFETVRRALQEQADGRRILLVVDDFGLLDPASLAVVVQLLSADAVRLVATLRDGEPIPESVLSMWTEGTGRRIDLPSLSVPECAELLGAVLAAPVAHRAVTDLHAASNGNPLFLRELSAGVVETGDLHLHGGIWQLLRPPRGTSALHDLIRARLERFEPADFALIRRLAVCHTLTLEEAVGDGARDHAIRLERAGVVVLRENDDALWLSLAHPQYGEAIRASLSRLERIEILAAQARATAALPSSPAHELRIAVWRRDAGEPGDAATLARAAQLAAAVQDHTSAARFAADALAAGGPAADLLLQQGYSLWITGDNEQAIRVLEDASAADRAAPGPLERAAGIASALASAYGRRRFGEAAALAVLERAVAERPELAGGLAYSRAVLLTNLEQAGAAAAVLAEIPASPSSAGDDDPHHVATALVRCLVEIAQGRSAVALSVAEAAVRAAMFENEPVIALRRARMVLGSAQLWCSQLIAAESTANLALAEAIEYHDEPSIAYTQLLLADCALAQGHLRTAERWCREVIGSAGAQHQIRFRDQASARLTLALLWQGRTAEAESVRDGFGPALAEHDSIALLASVWVDVVAAQRREAIACLVTRAEALTGRGNPGLAAVLLHSACRLGEAAAAAPALAELAGATDSRDIVLLAEHGAAEAAGDLNRLAAVGTAWQALGSQILAAEAFASAARLASGRPATRLRQTAERLRALADGAQTPTLTRLGPTIPLTARESEVAALARSGLSTHRIAEHLTLSPRTVENHLQAVYQKLGVASRTEL